MRQRAGGRPAAGDGGALMIDTGALELRNGAVALRARP